MRLPDPRILKGGASRRDRSVRFGETSTRGGKSRASSSRPRKPASGPISV